MRSRTAIEAVCFDCDSTLTRIEGIDELARRAGIEGEIAPLTAAAMEGRLSLDAIYARRLELVRPDRESIEWLGTRYLEEMVPGARQTIAALKEAGKSVHIVSGGLRPALEPLARALEVPLSNVHAVDVSFKDDGAYRDFDRRSPLIHPDGKAIVCPSLAAAPASVALVGDGATDLAARNSGVFVVGFGGVVQREALIKGADVFIAEPDLTSVLNVLLEGARCRSPST
jgi:phosphoserine phosphatase